MGLAIAENAFMSTESTGRGKKDRHKKQGFQMRLHPLLRQQLDKLVSQNATSISEEVRAAIRERLERMNLWPIHKK